VEHSYPSILQGILYFALLVAKTFFKYAGINVFFYDGTFSRSIGFKHTILIATTFDGNNQVMMLAFAIIEVEDANNWVWFKEFLEMDFPEC
jgi:hypothetical protein